jgi:hypothetical protein
MRRVVCKLHPNLSLPLFCRSPEMSQEKVFPRHVP